MIVSDGVYKRIPQIWLVMGIIFLLLGLAAGPNIEHFYAYPVLGAVCIARSLQIYQFRRNLGRRNRMTVLTETQKINRD